MRVGGGVREFHFFVFFGNNSLAARAAQYLHMGLTDWVMIINLSNRCSNARRSGQITSNFLTQASLRLYEIRQPPTSFQIRPLNSGEKYLRTDKTERTDWTDWTVRTDRKTWLTFKLELLLIWLKCATHWLVVTLAMIDIYWKSWLVRFGTHFICVSFICTQLLECSSISPLKLI